MSEACHHLLYNGACHAHACPLNHDFKYCAICAVVCSPVIFSSHENGRQHRVNLAARPDSSWLVCSVCDVRVSGERCWYQHVSGAAHRTKAQTKGLKPTVLPRQAEVLDSYRCFTCTRVVHVNDWLTHLKSGLHKRLQNVAYKRLNIQQAAREQDGATVSHGEKGVDFGVVTRAVAQRGIQVDVTVKSASFGTSLVRADTYANNGGTACP